MIIIFHLGKCPSNLTFYLETTGTGRSNMESNPIGKRCEVTIFSDYTLPETNNFPCELDGGCYMKPLKAPLLPRRCECMAYLPRLGQKWPRARCDM